MNYVGRTVRTRVNLRSLAEPIRVHPVGSEGLVVDVVATGMYIVEIRVSDANVSGGAWYDTLELRDSDFAVEQSDVA